ncbi:phospholipase D/nuclease [Polyplosphaeria fusca]|uniref:Phospholipase D/nuclease n=1 Tax=Polyplosphaeria fusca TaxID=682080 RepID=A0A9P4QM29_9PLEO|nr:phospholipase D/nuclease [Polyplosphaeria fusca]
MSTSPIALENMSSDQGPFTSPFLSTLDSAVAQNSKDDPNYYVDETRSLVSTSTVHGFTTGTGSAVYESLAPLLESTSQELILVTCFWSRSSTLDTLNDVLRKLSDKAIRRGTEKIRVRLCFSSLSLFQKLFHTQSVNGQFYPKETWAKKLGIPPASELGGLDMTVKSVFLLPFSVMHPKFMIIDRKMVVLPSCNVSWEEWFEGAILCSGPIVTQFTKFYNHFWHRDANASELAPVEPVDVASMQWKAGTVDHGHGHLRTQLVFPDVRKVKDITTVFLPSPHRRNPQFRPFSSAERVIAPPTPLNVFILTVFAKAERKIRIQTPNITSPPILSALLKALARGIEVQILTSEKLMILEQLVTAGRTTSQCVATLIKKYKKMLQRRHLHDEEDAIASARPGRLQISYFTPSGGAKSKGREGGEPQQSHLKMTIVDDEVLVLGSGNFDRASWFTSQELGLAFFDRTLAESVASVVDVAIKGRTKLVFDSAFEPS